MAKKSYKWLERLIDRITKKDQPNNDSFDYYGHSIMLSSGTRDYVSVYIEDMQIDFSFDFCTKGLCFESYNDYDERDAIINAFKRIYNDKWDNVSIKYDGPWEEDRKGLELLVDNDEYDQKQVTQEYNELMSHKAA